MVSPDWLHLGVAFGAAFLAGGINSVAGGGTLVSFPTLIWLGLPSVMANATNTLGIWPGSLGSIWGFRHELRQTDRAMRALAVPAFLGGATGAMLLRSTPAALFDRIVPFLVLFATVLFTAQGPIQRKFKSAQGLAAHSRRWIVGAVLFQYLVGVYGGYFGAAMSIMMLSALSLLGMTDILKMNALTSFFALSINGIAAVLFIQAGLVYWPFAAAMAAGAIIGGYGAAGVARRVGRTMVRRFVIAVGFAISAALFVRII